MVSKPFEWTQGFVRLQMSSFIHLQFVLITSKVKRFLPWTAAKHQLMLSKMSTENLRNNPKRTKGTPTLSMLLFARHKVMHHCSCKWWSGLMMIRKFQKSQFYAHYELFRVFCIVSNEWASVVRFQTETWLPFLLTSDPSDHPDNHRLRWQDPADVDGTVVIRRVCSAGDFLLRSASCESNTTVHTLLSRDWRHLF